MASSASSPPSLYIPHGGGPCFFMDWTMGPADTWHRMGTWLGELSALCDETPRAVLVISAHWEAPVATVTSGASPPLVYDYYGFPRHTYELTYPAPGAPALASEIRSHLEAAGIDSGEDRERGFDHGVFVPFKLIYPDAAIPIVQLSLLASLDPQAHLELGQALAPLRETGVLIVGSGMSYHNLQRFMRGETRIAESDRFDAWLQDVCTLDPSARSRRLCEWSGAPDAHDAHPREEHLLPLMVAAGAGGTGRCVYTDRVMGATVSAFAFA